MNTVNNKEYVPFSVLEDADRAFGKDISTYEKQAKTIAEYKQEDRERPIRSLLEELVYLVEHDADSDAIAYVIEKIVDETVNRNREE